MFYLGAFFGTDHEYPSPVYPRDRTDYEYPSLVYPRDTTSLSISLKISNFVKKNLNTQRF